MGPGQAPFTPSVGSLRLITGNFGYTPAIKIFAGGVHLLQLVSICSLKKKETSDFELVNYL